MLSRRIDRTRTPRFLELPMICQPSLSMTIAFESPDQPEVIALITELDAYQDTLYPPESRHYLDLPSLNQSNVFFAVARDGEVGRSAVVRWCSTRNLTKSNACMSVLAAEDKASRGSF